ncbi:RICIN domain-containing protein [Yinghuangia seranimata]|uniref:RICIN domain-containing protein n=1 Tax=Yinghuangia seranimata TaxID=408067 RepID=UPI00248AC3B7|nr:RICIN domain-containing protein [Yinghuangia seranimata]MDI2126300.1 RICIN domain-containing protein [Yinghuangia seranimata]
MKIRRLLTSAAGSLALAAGLLGAGTGTASAETHQWTSVLQPILVDPYGNEPRPNLCLGVLNGSTDNGAPVIIWECNGNYDQKWSYFTREDGSHMLKNYKSGKCLDIPEYNFNAGTRLVQWDCNGGTNQTWYFSSDTYFKNPASGMVLDDPGGSRTWGTQAIIWPQNGGNNQYWQTYRF